MANVMDVAKFFIALANQQAEVYNEEGISNMGLNKLLYFAQGTFLARYGKPLFQNAFEAWEHGPVIPAVYGKYKKFGNSFIHDETPSPASFTKEEFGLLCDVAREYLKYSASELRRMSHVPNGPWEQVYIPHKEHIQIPNESIKAYFSEHHRIQSFDEIISQSEKIQAIVPKRDQNGVAVFPAEAADGWEGPDD